jgi:hypothetical protein
MFHKYCDKKGATIILVKTNLSGEIIGGYDPNSWGNNESSSDFETSLMDVDEELIVGPSSSSSQKMVLNGRNNSCKQTKRTDAFLFSFNKNNENK